MLEFDEIKRFSSVYTGAIALAVFVIRKLAGYVEFLFFPVVRANRAFREGILSFVRMGIAPTKEELQILKRGVSERAIRYFTMSNGCSLFRFDGYIYGYAVF